MNAVDSRSLAEHQRGGSSAETTAGKQHCNVIGRPFPKGVSGNPTGRPKGARHKLEAHVLEALAADFAEHGIEAIRRCREEKPESYLSAIVKVLPKHDSLDVHVSKRHEEALNDLE